MSATFSRTTRFLDGDRSSRRLVEVLVVLLLAGWAGWFILGRVTVHEVTAKARLEVQSAAHAVAAPVGGRVVETRLTIGREVQAGDVLLVLDAEAERRAIQQKRTRCTALSRRLSALRREIEAQQAGLLGEQKARTTALAEAQAQVAEGEARARFAEQQEGVLTGLLEQQAVSDEEYRKGKAEAEAARACVRKLTLATSRLEQDRLVQENDRKARLAKLERETVEIEGEIATEESGISRLEHEVELHIIRAPVLGQVGEVASEFQGGSVVQAAQKLGCIIPPGETRTVALFPVASVGRIRPGQTARLRLDGFPWTQYGTIPATVAKVGNEASGGLIRVELNIIPSATSPIPLGHGLPGSVEVEVEHVSPATLVLRAAGQFLSPGQ